jgi:hypothetical protein
VNRHFDRAVATLMGACTVGVLRLTSASVGLTRDEGYYFKAAQEYVGWYQAILTGQLKLTDAATASVVTRYFSYNHEHPALIKTFQGFAWWVWQKTAGLGLQSEAFRWPGPVMAGLCVALTYLLGTRLYGRGVGVFAALSWALLPRNFFHQHLACFDVPVTALTVLVVYAYVVSGTSLKRAAWCGLALGACMATKHNALFIPPLLVVHWLATSGAQFRRENAWLHLPPIPVVFLAMLLLGPLVFVAHWPWLWADTLKRLGEYYGYHFLHHEHYPITYFGTLWRLPPFPYGFSLGMTLVTVPLPVLGLTLVGLGICIRDGFFSFTRHEAESPRQRKDAAWLLGLFSVFPMVVISLPTTPIFGGVKHWMPATPFLAIMAGLALREATAAIRKGFPRASWFTERRAFITATPLFLITCVTGVLRSAPHGQCFYNELIGGARGAALVGMQRHYWGEAGRPLLSVINEKTLPNGRVFFNRTNPDSHQMYVRDGLLRRDIGYAPSVADSTAAISFHQWEHEHELYNIWNNYGVRQPLAGVYLEGGVPLTQLYRRP